jgi:hypothetical protein
MIIHNPEQDNEAAQAIRWAREKSPYRSQREHIVCVWACFRNCFTSVHEYVEAISKGFPHLYGEYHAAIATYEQKWKRTDGLTEMMRRVKR